MRDKGSVTIDKRIKINCLVKYTIPSNIRSKIESEANRENVPIFSFDGNSLRLAKLCNKSFRINAIALKAGTDAQIDSILSDIQFKDPTYNR
jgi:ribosomal protein L30E